MAEIYLMHHKHGVKIATMEMEAQYDEQNGWVRFDPADLVEDYAKRRLSFLMDLPHWGTFGKGWSRRVAEVQTVASTMTA